jgi:hypothetical protein
MDTDHVATALRNCASGLYAAEAGVALLISDGTFLHRDDFTSRFIEHGPAAPPRRPTSTGTPPSPPSPTATSPAPEANAESSS